MNVGEPSNVYFDKCAGLEPAVVQHFATGEVLMLGDMNPEALHVTCTSGFVTFWSRSSISAFCAKAAYADDERTSAASGESVRHWLMTVDASFFAVVSSHRACAA